MKAALRVVPPITQPAPKTLEPASLDALALLQSKLGGQGVHMARALLEPARYVLSRPGKGFRARLMQLAFSLAGGQGKVPHVLPLMVELLHAGSLVIDDVEDGSHERRGIPALHRVVGEALAINTGNWLYFVAQDLIAELDLPAASEVEVNRAFARTMERSHRGQALDLSVDVTRLAGSEVESVADAIVVYKTGTLMAFAARLGALSAGATSEQVEALARFGLALGLGLQHLDDWGGLSSARMRDKGLEDLRLRRVTWAWSFLSQRLAAEDYAQLRRELEVARDEAALDDVRGRLATRLRELDAPAHIRRELSIALVQLKDELCLSEQALHPLADEIARLEVSYG